MLSESYLNNSTDILRRLYNTQNVLGELYYKMYNLNYGYKYKSLSSILDKLTDNMDFVGVIQDYFNGFFPRMNHYKLGIKIWEEKKKLENIISNLDLSNENQTMALNNLKIDEIYEKRIVNVSNFTINGHSKITLYYDVILPFHDKNYDEITLHCTHQRDLAVFFRVRTNTHPYLSNIL